MQNTTLDTASAAPAQRIRDGHTADLGSASKLLKLADGRQLAWSCFGDPSGPPLYVFHGMPGSRLQAALIHEQARAAGVCVVAPDRPGMGGSSFQPGREIMDWPRDVEALADHLGHAQLGVLGISCGGPYALACALSLSKRVLYTGLVAGAGPMDERQLTANQMPALRMLFGLSRACRWFPAPILKLESVLLSRVAARAVLKLASAMTPPDRDLLVRDEALRDTFGASLAEAYSQGIRGVLHEVALIARPHGVPLHDIHGEVHIYQGGEDRHVPPEMGRHLASELPHGRLHCFPEAGHLSIVIDHFADCLRDFLWHVPPQLRPETGKSDPASSPSLFEIAAHPF